MSQALIQSKTILPHVNTIWNPDKFGNAIFSPIRPFIHTKMEVSATKKKTEALSKRPFSVDKNTAFWKCIFIVDDANGSFENTNFSVLMTP